MEARQPTDIAPAVSSKLPIGFIREPTQAFQQQSTRRAGDHLNALMYLQVAHVLFVLFALVIHRIRERKLRRW